MSAIFSKLWPGLALAVILALGCLLLYSKCNKAKPAPDPDMVAAVASARQAGYDSAQRLDTPQIMQDRVKIDSLTDLTNDLLEDKLLLQFQLDTLGDRIGNTLVATDEARIKHDTVLIVQNCDSLEAQVKEGIPMVTGYTTLTDSIVKTYVARAVVQDSIIAKLIRDNALGASTITAQQLAYQIVNKDDNAKTAQLRIYKPVAKGGAAIIVGYIVLKILLK